MSLAICIETTSLNFCATAVGQDKMLNAWKLTEFVDTVGSNYLWI